MKNELGCLEGISVEKEASFIDPLTFHNIGRKMICLKGKELNALATIQFLPIVMKILRPFAKSWFVSMVIIKKNTHLNPSIIRFEIKPSSLWPEPKR